MEIGQEFFNSLPFIIFFLLLSLLIGVVVGEKSLFMFLLLVLFGMVVLNSGKFETLFSKIKI